MNKGVVAMDGVDVDEDAPLIDTTQFVVDCPICNSNVHLAAYHAHMLDAHPVAYMAMLSAYFPTTSDELLLQAFDNMSEMLGMENYAFTSQSPDTYEDLLELCDSIGYHHVGLDEQEIDQAAPIVDDSSGASADACSFFEHCPICLDDLVACGKLRRMQACKHVFCSPCIEKWLREHKWCPVCKKDVRGDSVDSNKDSNDAQMASISTSLSSSLLPVIDVRPDSSAGSSSSINTT